MSQIPIPIMADLAAQNKQPEYLYWVGCAGAFDERYKKVARSFAKILNHLNIDYAVLGTEESCTGDPAKRAGNEMLFQMQALQNIELFNSYGIKKIICTCPHCFNILKNEYPELGGVYEVFHYTSFLEGKINSGELKLNKDVFKDERLSFHDPCYLGRGNGIYEAPRSLISSVSNTFTELKRNKSFALCCGAGGAQMFKESEPGDKEVFVERTEDVIESQASIVASSCPFCMTMLSDGIKYANKEESVKNMDISELIWEAIIK